MDDQADVHNATMSSRGDTVNTNVASTLCKARPGFAVESGDVKVAKQASELSEDCYDMNHERRGFAIIFNNRKFDRSTKMSEREGTDIDAEELYMILSEMGFDVDIKKDCTKQEMESVLKKAGKRDHSKMDCFVCAVFSHGDKGCVYGKDGPVKIDKLVGPFKGRECRTLAGKPKIFFIQACQGSKLDDGVDVADVVGVSPEEDKELETRKIPSEADFLMAYSTVPGYYSWRNSLCGSWFGQALVKVLRKNWKRMDLLSMMTRVSRTVAQDFESHVDDESMSGKKQIPCITSMLTRDVYFTPKEKVACLGI